MIRFINIIFVLDIIMGEEDKVETLKFSSESVKEESLMWTILIRFISVIICTQEALRQR